jgi:KRAB domain-containing zinc finger protein
MMVHRREGMYKCSFCERTFRYASLLTMHERVHTGVRPHACSVCGATFAREYSLTIHMRRHTGLS